VTPQREADQPQEPALGRRGWLVRALKLKRQTTERFCLLMLAVLAVNSAVLTCLTVAVVALGF
jgi:hypothetical protein